MNAPVTLPVILLIYVFAKRSIMINVNKNFTCTVALFILILVELLSPISQASSSQSHMLPQLIRKAQVHACVWIGLFAKPPADAQKIGFGEKLRRLRVYYQWFKP